jgi:sensor histidine kinase regulating citrate/malate metabolism
MRRWLRSLSLRTRLLGVIVTVTLIAIGTFGLLALRAEQQAARRALASEITAMATLVANRSAAARRSRATTRSATSPRRTTACSTASTSRPAG